ncbi:RNA-binding protein 7 [Falco peregrinus]|uniref:RNA-binding protein 7 n=1 Tax=Falco peregrinus TaxID=8954 RepID=UPI00225F88C0|nr:RNA-binding protein 7 [Falco peregrinus]
MGAAAAEADRTLFVGNLDPKVTEELIFELFHQAGPVITVKIPKDRDGRPKQFAFVNFKHEESVPYGLSLLNGIKLYGRPIKIQFRSGSSHASQDGNPLCSPHGAASTSLSSTLHPASNCSRYDRGPDSMVAAGFTSSQRSLPLAENLQRQAVMNSTMWQQPPFGGKYEQPGFALPGYQHAPHGFHPLPASQMPRRPEMPVSRKGRLSAHPYHLDGRHFGREQRFGDRGPDYCRGKREEYGFEERGHDAGAEHHFRAGREEPGYDDRHGDGWNHDYRRESYRDREAKWHPARH